MKYELRQSADGTFTLFSKEYNECYHSLSDGALRESLNKHVIPAFTFNPKSHLRILDICFGLGINTLATIYYLGQQKAVRSAEIFSPELDSDLLQELKYFEYPQPLQPYREILLELIENKVYKSKNIHIELFIGDAREYIKGLQAIDVVYQDPFSPKKNPALWTVEYFQDIAKILDRNGVVTTYSIATPVRLALDEVGFKVYEYEVAGIKKMTIASFKELPLKQIDMDIKRSRATVQAMRDQDIEKN